MILSPDFHNPGGKVCAMEAVPKSDENVNTRAEMWVHILREGLKTAILHMTDERVREAAAKLIGASEAYARGAPRVQEGECLQVGDELWPIDRGGNGSTIAFQTPRRSGFVFRADATELIAAGIPIVAAREHPLP